MYMYMYIERDREKESKREKEKERDREKESGEGGIHFPEKFQETKPAQPGCPFRYCSEWEFFIDNLLVRIHYHRDDFVDRPRAMGV